jgi:hypothetical protein
MLLEIPCHPGSPVPFGRELLHYPLNAGIRPSPPIPHEFRHRGVMMRVGWFVVAALWFVAAPGSAAAQEQRQDVPHWLWSKAFAIPKETTNQGSGYFSIIQGKNGRLYIGTAKYGENAFLVEFDSETEQMRIVVDAHKEIGTDAKGFAAQSKIHTRNNVGESGKIYFATKQGYPMDGEPRTAYPGGYPLVFDPETSTTRVYPIPVAHQGIISITPDEPRGRAYISTCSDERPIESTHFMILDLESGAYRELLDCRHMYAFIVVDFLGRAYHPILGGQIARYDPRSDAVVQLSQTIDGQPPTAESLLAHPESHPINWDLSPDKRTLYSVAMSGNQLYAYDLTGEGTTLVGRSLGPLVAKAEQTDCRALNVAGDGTVWAGVAASFPGQPQRLHVVRYKPGDPAPTDLGPVAIGNPDYTQFTDDQGQALPWHHGVERLEDGTLIPRYVVMGICGVDDRTAYLLTLAPFTIHKIHLPQVAGVTTIYHHNAHADVILSRLLETDTLDGQGQKSSVELASLFIDQMEGSDKGRALAEQHAVPLLTNVADALTLKSDRLAVDGVLLVAEHGNYPESDTGQFMFPKRRLFGEIVDEFRRQQRVVPVFCDKHLADNWEDARWIYDTARSMQIPLMAGSSLPVLWREPPADVRREATLREIVAVSYHRLDVYGFHALEMVQSLVERRAGGETGVAAVQCLSGDAVWKAADEGRFDRRLLDEALARLRVRPVPADRRIEDLVPEPELFLIEYADGLRAVVLTLNPFLQEWSSAWRYADDTVESTCFVTQEARPFQHFSYLLQGVEKMVFTGKPAWPVERTLLTSGTLDSLLISRRDGGMRLATPHLAVKYHSDWNWHQPPPPPPDRPIHEQ